MKETPMLNQTTHMTCGIILWKRLREDQCECQRQLVRTYETSFVRHRQSETDGVLASNGM